MLRVQLEVTTRCNLNCSYCPRGIVINEGTREVKDIDFDFFKTIVNRLKKQITGLLGRKKRIQISISGLGEPTLYPELIDCINLLRKKLGRRALLKINTNAVTLKGDIVDKLIGSELDIMVCSLNLATPELYSEMKGGSYDAVIDNVTNFLIKKGNSSPSTRIRTIATDLNSPHIPEMRGFWIPKLNHNDLFFLGGLSNWGGKIDRGVFTETELPEREVCHYLWEHLTINLDGECFPCCLGISENKDSVLYLGNIRDMSIKDILEVERVKLLRRQHTDKKYNWLCEGCDSWKRTGYVRWGKDD